MWQISRVIGLAILLVLSIEDICFRKISEYLLLVLAVLGVIYQIGWGEVSFVSIVGGVGIGVTFLFISYITKEALGYGDSLLIGILGLYLGTIGVIETLIVAWGMATFAAGIVLIRKRFSKKTIIPFVPFLTGGYMVESIFEYLEQFVR